MKINDNSLRPAPLSPLKVVPVSPQSTLARPAPASASRARDKVTLSDTATTVSTASQCVKAMPEADMAKVAAVKIRIENGTYQVNADKAAANILAESLLKD